jgi:DNA-binding CsgD family transcriptional regulator
VAELDRIVSRLAETGPAAFVLAGAAGVGKTRLAAEAAKWAAESGQATAHVVATKAAASIPFGAFATLLPDADALLGGRLSVLRSAGEAIVERRGGAQRLVLVVDDVQLLDEASAALVLQLVHTASCSLLATVRTPGPAPDPVTALWKDGLADRIDLSPLSEADVEAFATEILGGPVAGATVRRLWEASRGNALYVRELLRGAAATDALANDRGIWVLRRPLTAPDRLVELVTLRLDDLDGGTVQVVDLLAVAGSLGYALLETLTSSDAIEDAERRGLMEVVEDGRRSQARLTHPLYGEVLRQRLPKSRTRRLWTALAEALAATGARRREDLLRLASWQLDTGMHDDPALLARAARRARQMFDMDLAARLGRAAVDAGGGVDAGLVLAEAEFISGHHEEANRVLTALVPLCANDAELVAVTNAQAYNLGILMGDPDAAVQVIDEALKVVTDPGSRLLLEGRAATTRLMAGDSAAALDAAAEALASDDDAVVIRGTFVSSMALAFLGRTREAVAVARRGFDVHRRSPEATQLPESQLIGATIGHAGGGALAEAMSSAMAGYHACLEAGDKEGIASFSLLCGWVQVDQGLLRQASRSFREGAAANREINDTGALRWCLGGVALAEGMAGRSTAASEAITELDDLRPDWMFLFEANLVDRGRAWAKAAAGEMSAAREALREAAERAAGRQQWVAEAQLLHDIARLGAPGLVAPRLSEVATVVDGELVGLLARHGAALVHMAADDLEQVSLGFEKIGALLLAAEAGSAAATAYRNDGRARQASACARRAQEHLSACGDISPPGLFRSHDIDRLTAREREVAGLAALGASSREIAERLYISVRTVDNHLNSVYIKLGVTNREQLAEALGVSSS